MIKTKKTLSAIFSSLSALFLSTALICSVLGLLNSYLSLRLDQNKISTFVISIVLSLYYLGYIAATITSQRIINQFGHIRAFSAFASLFSALALLHYTFTSTYSWGALRLIEGYCVACCFMCLESWINSKTSNKKRGMVMATYMVISYLGASLGQLFLNIKDGSGIYIYIIVSIVVSISLIPVSLTTLSAPKVANYQKMSLKKLYQASPVGVMACIVSGCLVGIFYTMGPVYAQSMGLQLKDISLFLFYAIIGGMISQIPLGRLSDVFDRRFILMYICSFTFWIVPWLHFFLPDAGWHMIAASIILGAATFSVYSIAVSHVNDLIKNKERVGASGALLMLQSLGMVFGPIVVGFFMQNFGVSSFIFSYSIITGLFILFALKHIVKKPNIKYIEVTTTEPTAFNILPDTTQK